MDMICWSVCSAVAAWWLSKNVRLCSCLRVMAVSMVSGVGDM